ncbi:MAG: AgmX/PglI C-terminal domain-containing protein [Deltaproteobacteria bacterium]|nr:AgmX/PglI C-terminal domain-containing protein [Deltaproteobacteria bacterium]
MTDTPTGDLVLVFAVYKGDSLLTQEEFQAESVTIGGGPAAMLRVEGEGLGDLHAVINVNDDGTVQLLDLGSANGTRVNGEVVSNVALTDGDAIEMGDIRVTVAMRTASGATLPVTAPHEGESLAVSEAAPEKIAEDVTEDVMAFIMRSGGGDASVSRGLPKVLEVTEIWGDVIMDNRRYGRGSKPVTLGSRTGCRWRWLGMPVAWMPPFWSKVSWIAGPTISEGIEELKAEFYCPPEDLPHEEFPLFEWNGAEYVCNISDKWAGFVDVGEERHTFQELIEGGRVHATGNGMYQITITEDTRIVVDIGHVIFFAHMVYPGRVAAVKFGTRVDYPFLLISGFIGFIGLMFGIVIFTMPPPPDNEVMEVPDRFVELLLEEPVKEDDLKADEPEGAKAKKEEGKVGKKDAKMDKAKGDKVEMRNREMDKQIAENAGVLGALRDGSELDSMLNQAGLNQDLMQGIGGLIGAKGTQFGAGGLGGRGSGLGGGGTASGLGGLGTKGRGSGAAGYGTGGGHFGAKGEGQIGTIGGEAIVLGALDKSLVDAVVRRHLNQIRYCYQRELTKDPTLAGKIVVKFVIAKDGTVSSASTKSSTMNNSPVEQCINGRFMRFQFPEPKGGGIVIVSYPFIFSPG